MSFINESVLGIEISGIRKFLNIASNYPNAISLTIGQPDLKTPDHIIKKSIEALENGYTVYTPNKGIAPLLKGVSSYMNTKYSLNYSSEDEIIVTSGASEAIDTALRTIISNGDEVIIPSPAYPGYEPLIKILGGKCIYIDTTEDNFKLTASKLKNAITKNTKCLILPYPSNPTGTTLTYEEILSIAQVALDSNILVLSDEVYSELCYNGPHISIGNIDFIRNNVIIVNALSKSHSMTGFRIGFLLAPKYLTDNFIKVHQYNSTCASSISQYAALEAVTNGLDDPLYMKEEYIKRRDYVYNRLVDMNLNCTLPTGGFYFFPSIKKFNSSSYDFALDLLDKAGVAVVPSTAFSGGIDGYIRISYVCSMEDLEEALNRLENYLITNF
ncbi:MAG: aminotransferase class I/II-fold pyridoxal phosphate-dependent enzyme [Clostridium sp.]